MSKHINILNSSTDSEVTTYIDTLTKTNLSQIIKHLNTEYYVNNNSVVSDTIYDLLKERLELIDPTNKLLSQVGADSNRKKVPLPFHMGSMDKIKQTDGEKFDKWKSENYSKHYVLTPKYDGISGLFVYNEKESKLYTRGNGMIGQDVSHFIPHLKIDFSKLKKLNIKDIAIRGEFIMSKRDFDLYSADNEASNSRNLIGGLINSKTIDKNILQYLKFVPYEVIGNDLILSEQLKLLKQFIPTTTNFEIVEHDELTINKLSEVFTRWRTTFEYTIDGVIVCTNELYERNTSGNPSYAFAYKQSYDEQQKIVIVQNVEWNVSKDGYLKPVILIPSTEINGVFIERVTGNNARFITDNGIGIGSKIKIIRSNDVIPKVEEVLIKKEPCMPTVSYEWNETAVDILATEETDEQKIKELSYFFTTIDTVGVSTGVIRSLVENGFNTIEKILALTPEILITLPSFKEKKSEAVYTAIHEALNKAELCKLMQASNLLGRTLGSKKIKLILDGLEIHTIEDLQSKHITVEEVKKIHGFEEKTATLFVENLPKFLNFYSHISKFITKPKETEKKETKTDSKFKGKNVVLTGFRSKQLEELIVNSGGFVKSSVSKNTDIVITTKDNETSAKILKAKELGITIMFF